MTNEQLILVLQDIASGLRADIDQAKSDLGKVLFSEPENFHPIRLARTEIHELEPLERRLCSINKKIDILKGF